VSVLCVLCVECEMFLVGLYVHTQYKTRTVHSVGLYIHNNENCTVLGHLDTIQHSTSLVLLHTRILSMIQYLLVQRQDVLFTSFRGASERKMGGKIYKARPALRICRHRVVMMPKNELYFY
jgi:hypothetical protein